MTITSNELDLSIFEELDFEPACDGYFEHCVSPESPVRWIGILKCCGHTRLFCDPCRVKIAEWYIQPRRIVYCRFCFSMEFDNDVSKEIKFIPYLP